MIRSILLASAALALCACGQQATTADNGAASAPPPAPTQQASTQSAAAFAQAVANSDAFEIQSSELAAQRASRQQVKDFAATMVRDHAMTTQQLTALAPQINLAAPAPRLDPAEQGQIDSLRAQTGAGFDSAYIDAQVAAHTEAVALFESFADAGEAGPLRDWASQTLPKLREHLTHAEALRS